MEVFENYTKFVDSSKSFGIIKSTVLLNLHDFCVIKLNEKQFIYYKHENKPNVTFVVQGMPLKDVIAEYNIEDIVCNLLKFGFVVMATWDNLKNLKRILIYIRENNIENGQNVFLQVYSTYIGLNKCKTEYAIKVRADEWYKDFSAFITAMQNHPDHLITHNMFFRNIGQYPYHISDHVIGGKTENLLKMFQSCKDILDKKETLPDIPRMLTCCPEQWLTVAYMRCFYTKDDLLDIDKITEKMQKHFFIVPITAFKDFRIRYTQHKKRYNIKGIQELQNHSHAFVISDISEVGK